MEITTLCKEHYPDFLALYEEAFPNDQRRPYNNKADLARFASQHLKFHALEAVEDGKLVGFLTYWVFNKFTYIEHFAVRSDCRCGGIGTAILQHMIKNVGSELLLEVELPLTDNDRRRIAFYKRLGFRLNESFLYTQPPYTPDSDEVPMRLMTHGDVTVSDYDDLREMMTEVYNKKAGSRSASITGR